MRLRLLATMALLLCTCDLSGQQQPAPPAPTFRAQVDLVELDVRVTDASGTFVAGLTDNDFEIFEDGKPQTVAALSLVNIPIDAVAPSLRELPVDPDVHTNTIDESRVYVIAMDEGISSEQILRARMFLRRFVERYFGPNDIGAVVWVGQGAARDTQDFTSSRRRLLAALDRFQGGLPSAAPPASLVPPQVQPSPGLTGTSIPSLLPAPSPIAESATRTRMRSLRSLAEFMAGMRGRRKALLYVSTGIGFDMFDVLDYRGGIMSLALADAHAAMTAATRGNVTIYVIDPRGLSSDGALADRDTAVSDEERAGMRNSRRNLRTFAELTGGFAFTDQNDIDSAFTRIVRENSSYYVLGFSSTNSRNDGRFRRIEARVKRPGLSVRSRTGYMAPSGRPKPAAPPSSTSLAPAVAEAIASPLRTPGLPMRVVATPYKGRGREADILLVVEVDATRLDLIPQGGRYTGKVDIAWTAVSADGRSAPSGHYRSTLALEPNTYDRALHEGVRFVSELSLPPGRYQLRVGAGSLSGAAGGVIADLEVPDFTQVPLAMSGLALTSRRSAHAPTHLVKSRLQGALPAPPSAQRSFDVGDEIAVYAEVYRGRPVSAKAISATVVLRDEAGRVVQTASAERSSPDAGRPGLVAALSLGDVAAGVYVVRFEARADSDGDGSVSREIPIHVK